MNYQNFVDSICETACILSVKMLPDSDEKEITIAACNSSFLDTISTLSGKSDNKFVPNSQYNNYFPHNSTLDEMTIQAAILKVPAHHSTSFEGSDYWANLTWIPLSDEDNSSDIFYCCLIIDLSEFTKPDVVTDQSATLANTLLNICERMNKSTTLVHALRSLISDLSDLSNVEGRICVLTKDSLKKKALIVTVEGQSDVIDATFGQAMEKSLYQVSEDWITDLGYDDYISLSTPADFEKYREKDPKWIESLITFSVDKLVLFPLIFKDEIVGFIWSSIYGGISSPDDYNDRMKQIFQKISFAVANLIVNYQLEDHLSDDDDLNI